MPRTGPRHSEHSHPPRATRRRKCNTFLYTAPTLTRCVLLVRARCLLAIDCWHFLLEPSRSFGYDHLGSIHVRHAASGASPIAPIGSCQRAYAARFERSEPRLMMG